MCFCPVFDLLYGGARGGGKTDGMLGEFAIHAGLYGRHASGLMLRRTRLELADTIERSKQIYTLLGWKYNDSKHTWRAPNGARLKFAFLDKDRDADLYQGHAYTRIYVEEIGNFPSPVPILKLFAALRSAHGVPVGFRATANPGGPGHSWVKERYITPARDGYQLITDEDTGLQRIYIPSRVSDNPKLIENDPTYVQRLKGAGSKELVKAWLEGDWDIVSGAFFDNWNSALHVIAPFPIPPDWLKFRAMDWGSAKPFSIGWYAVADGDERNGVQLPRGALVKYREWYGMQKGKPNVGLKLTAEQVADGILQREREGEAITYGVADPSMWKVDGGPSIAERMRLEGVTWRQADNGRLNGWDQLRSRLGDADEGDEPMLYFFSNCIDTIRTIPVMQHDADYLEDIDTEAEDHAPDETRYAAMSRPYVRSRTASKSDGPAVGTFDWLLKVTGKQQEARSKYRS